MIIDTLQEQDRKQDWKQLTELFKPYAKPLCIALFTNLPLLLGGVCATVTVLTRDFVTEGVSV